MNFKNKNVKLFKNDLILKNSFSVKDHFKIKNNKNTKPLNLFLEKSFINSNIDSSYYCDISDHYLLSNKNISKNSLLLKEEGLTYITKEGFETKNKCPIEKNDILIGNNGSVGDVLIIDNDKNRKIITNSNLTIIRFLKDANKEYFLGIFYSDWFKDYCSIVSTKSGTQEFIPRDVLVNMNIPFPTTDNNLIPENIEILLTLITKNIINKETQIKNKNNEINFLFEKELKDNQNNNNFKFQYPRLSDLLIKSRLDTGIYDRKYKEIENLIINYKNGYFNIKKDCIKTGKTPKDYFYPDSKVNAEVFNWITPKNTEKNILSNKCWIHTKCLTNIKDFDILVSSRGTVGNVFLYDKKAMGESYINQSMSAISITGSIHDKIFILCCLNSDLYRKMIKYSSSKGTIPSITPEDITKISFPNFNELDKEKISNLYYCESKKLNGLNLNNYEELEFERNKKLGIFQLNMELFDLRVKLNNIVSKIINNENIDIDLSY